MSYRVKLSAAFNHWMNREGGVDFGDKHMLRSLKSENGNFSRVRYLRANLWEKKP